MKQRIKETESNEWNGMKWMKGNYGWITIKMLSVKGFNAVAQCTPGITYYIFHKSSSMMQNLTNNSNNKGLNRIHVVIYVPMWNH